MSRGDSTLAGSPPATGQQRICHRFRERSLWAGIVIHHYLLDVFEVCVRFHPSASRIRPSFSRYAVHLG